MLYEVITGMNYKPAKYAEVQELYPDLPLYGSETSSCTSSRGVYHLPIEKYEKNGTNQVTSYDLIGPKWAYPPDIEFYFQEMNPRFMGEFVWTVITSYSIHYTKLYDLLFHL